MLANGRVGGFLGRLCVRDGLLVRRLATLSAGRPFSIASPVTFEWSVCPRISSSEDELCLGGRFDCPSQSPCPALLAAWAAWGNRETLP